MTYFGYTPAGDEINLGAPLSAILNREEDAPADDFTGLFPVICPLSLPPITVIRVFSGDSLTFYGIVDEQTVQTASGGSTVKLAARSRAAFLLDNEALPQTYVHPSLKTIFERHAAPYGFTGCLGTPGAYSGEMTVTKGMSEWQVIADFCAYFLGTVPKITPDGVLDASGEQPKERFYFSNMGQGIPYLSLCVRSKYHVLISEIYAQTGRAGEYALKNADEKSASLGVMRRRYLSAAKSGNAYFNSKQMMKAAHRKFQEIILVCPGAVSAELGAPATAEDHLFGLLDGMSIAKLSYTLNNAGEFTRITLRRDD